MKTKIILFSLSLFLIVIFCGCSKTSDPVSTTKAVTIITQTTTTTTTTTVVNTTTQTTTEIETLSRFQKMLIDISEEYVSSQIIFAFQDEEGSNKGQIFTFERTDDDTFISIQSEVKVVFGENGLDKEKEGDKKAPSGIFEMPYAFGTIELSSLLNIDYKLVTQNDYWIDDVNSDDYNTWQTYDGDPNEKWNSFERLMIEPYRLALVIDYNPEREKELGSAIFLHVWKDGDSNTSGCTATDDKSLFMMITWLDRDKNPIIVQGSLEYFENEFNVDIREEILDEAF